MVIVDTKARPSYMLSKKFLQYKDTDKAKEMEAFKKMEILTYATTGMNFKDMLSEIGQSQKELNMVAEDFNTLLSIVYKSSRQK